MHVSTPTRATTTLVALTIVFSAATAAHAIDSCKAKIDKRTGVILVDATNVQGTLLWGDQAGQENSAIFNVGTCVAAAKAKKCQLADPLTVASKTPPSGCTLYLDDGTAACSAWIPGCTPSPRRSTGALVKDSNGSLVGYASDSFGQTAVGEVAGVPLRLPLQPDGSGFLSDGAVYYVANNCSGSDLLPPDTGMIKRVVAVSNSAGLYGPPTGTMQFLESALYLISFVVDQAGCDGYFGPGTTHVAPHGCCFTFPPTPTLVGTAKPVALGSYVPPFTVDLP